MNVKKNDNIKKLCFLGVYDEDYSRNRILYKGFVKNGIDVVLCTSKKKGFFAYCNLIFKYYLLRNKDFDFIFVPYSEKRMIVFFVRLLTNKKIIWDAFYSLYDTKVFDREKVKKSSLAAKKYWFLDWIACKSATIILLDTHEHIEYFVKTFNIAKYKFINVPVGSDDEAFFPRKSFNNSGFFQVHFHGNYIPLHGIDYIVKAAKILEKENILFTLIGSSGQTRQGIITLCEKLNVQNINFLKSVPYVDLANYISNADICLGIFGKSNKAMRVIPNKVYEAAACGKLTITSDSLAIREIFRNGETIILTKPADENDLAKKILMIKNNKKLRESIGDNARNLFISKLTPGVIVHNLLNDINQYDKI